MRSTSGRSSRSTLMSPAILGWEVGAAEERLELRRQPDRHRPATAARGGLDERHVDAVHIGTLFAIHLDGHVVAVQEGGDLFVLEALALHDVAPVASGVANGKEDRLILQARLFESLFAPGVPIHRVMRVLQQIRTLLLRQTVGMQWKEPLGFIVPARWDARIEPRSDTIQQQRPDGLPPPAPLA